MRPRSGTMSIAPCRSIVPAMLTSDQVVLCRCIRAVPERDRRAKRRAERGQSGRRHHAQQGLVCAGGRHRPCRRAFPARREGRVELGAAKQWAETGGARGYGERRTSRALHPVKGGSPAPCRGLLVAASAATALPTGIRRKSRHVERASIDWWNNLMLRQTTTYGRAPAN